MCFFFFYFLFLNSINFIYQTFRKFEEKKKNKINEQIIGKEIIVRLRVALDYQTNNKQTCH